MSTPWRKSSLSNGANTDCVEVAAVTREEFAQA